MRNQEVFDKLQAARINEGFNNLSKQQVISDIPDLRTRLEALFGIPGFQEIEAKLTDSIIFRTGQVRIQVQQAEHTELQQLLAQYSIRLRGLYQYIEGVLADQNSDAVFIKLPPTEDFREAIRDQERFAKAIEQSIYIEKISGKISIKSWERGSLWLELAVGGSIAVSLIGSLAWAGAVVYKKIQEGRLHAEYFRGLKLKNDSLENMIQTQKELLSLLVDTEARNIASMHVGEDAQPETIERLKYTIKEFSELIEKGAEIHPALKAPESVRNLFPNFKNILGIESKTQMLNN